MLEPRPLVAIIPLTLAGQRLDQALVSLFPDYSRARLQQWVREGRAIVDGQARRPRDRVIGGERVQLHAEPEPVVALTPQPLPLEVVHADADLIVVAKPAGLVVHPGAGNRSGTLVNALLHRYPELAAIPRAGVVHRLDKDTTGALAVARSLRAHKVLVAALKARTVRRIYRALVVGRVQSGSSIDAPVGRHPTRRTRMAVVAGGRAAVTHYRISQRFRAHTELELQLETGRTHQIRVHLAHIGHPIVGDPTYGSRGLERSCTAALRRALAAFDRQALHASHLALAHPATGEPVEFEVPLPRDMAALTAALERDARGCG